MKKALQFILLVVIALTFMGCNKEKKLNPPNIKGGEISLTSEELLAKFETLNRTPTDNYIENKVIDSTYTATFFDEDAVPYFLSTNGLEISFTNDNYFDSSNGNTLLIGTKVVKKNKQKNISEIKAIELENDLYFELNIDNDFVLEGYNKFENGKYHFDVSDYTYKYMHYLFLPILNHDEKITNIKISDDDILFLHQSNFNGLKLYEGGNTFSISLLIDLNSYNNASEELKNILDSILDSSSYNSIDKLKFNFIEVYENNILTNSYISYQFSGKNEQYELNAHETSLITFVKSFPIKFDYNEFIHIDDFEDIWIAD